MTLMSKFKTRTPKEISKFKSSYFRSASYLYRIDNRDPLILSRMKLGYHFEEHFNPIDPKISNGFIRFILYKPLTKNEVTKLILTRGKERMC